MLTILGIGAAYPETILTNQLLEELSGGALSQRELAASGITARASVLPLEYLRTTGNTDAKAGEKAMAMTPTDLALQATLAALARAGVTAEQVGLILGDACSPVETTPSEAQRLGARLNIKANAYDMMTGGNAIVAQLATLAAVQPEKLPDIIVCVSANTPTQQINYRSGAGAAHFGDGAAAVVVSPRLPGRLTVHDAAYDVDGMADILTFEAYGHLRCDIPKLSDYIAKKGGEAAARLVSTSAAGCANLKVIPPQFDAVSNAAAAAGAGVDAARIWSNLAERGYTVGAAAFSVLADRWDTVAAGDEIAVIGVGGGSNFGHVLLRAG